MLDINFSSGSFAPTYDHPGNLTKDFDHEFVYDAWNNLVAVRSAFDADVTVATYAFFADDRRASRTVTNRGGLSGVTYYFYDGHEVIEERDGSGAVVQQYHCAENETCPLRFAQRGPVIASSSCEKSARSTSPSLSRSTSRPGGQEPAGVPLRQRTPMVASARSTSPS